MSADDAQVESRYELVPLPKYIRDPDSGFSAVWDLMQVVFLLYVSVIVPLRAGFEVEVRRAVCVCIALQPSVKLPPLFVFDRR